MVAGLLRAVPHRFVFIVGKGGAGKTTCAGALALAVADTGAATHLVSTDPAHSLGDLFGLDLGGGAAAGVCGAPLSLEEFDARAYAVAWIARHGDALAELIERGTYLGPERSRALLEPALPGIDEVMAALRLSELSDDPGIERVVVDTAPTGHTIRLLDAAATVQSWLAALAAVRAKAAAVGSALARRQVRFAADALIEELESAVHSFDETVLADAAFIPISRDEPVVLAETGRLRTELERRRLVVPAELRVGSVVGDDVRAVPFRPGVQGCAGLRWLASADRSGRGVAERQRREGPAPSRAAPAWPELRRRLADRSLVLVAGKGGVGKSTCAAALAAALAKTREVRLVSVDPAGSLEDVLDRRIDPGGSAIEPGLIACQIDPAAELERLRLEYRQHVEAMFAGIGVGAELDRAVVDSLWNLAPPGMDELAAMSVLADRSSEAGGPLTVVDAAPTGHFLRLLELPHIALDWIHALMRALLDQRGLVDLESAGRPLLRLSKRLRKLRMALSDPSRTAALVVTLPEPMVAAETMRLLSRLSRAAVPLAAVACNRYRPGVVVPDHGALRTILAPDLEPPPAGTAALRDFVERWSLVPATAPS